MLRRTDWPWNVKDLDQAREAQALHLEPWGNYARSEPQSPQVGEGGGEPTGVPRSQPQTGVHTAQTLQEHGLESRLGPCVGAGDGPSRSGFNKLLLLASRQKPQNRQPLRVSEVSRLQNFIRERHKEKRKFKN